MVVVKLQGGLGNQMFQYAFGLSISHKLSCPLYFDLSFFKNSHHGLTPREYALDAFTCKVNIAEDKLIDSFFNPDLYQRINNKLGISKKTIYHEHGLKFNNRVLAIKPPAYLEGFWQSAQYFNDIKDTITTAFTFKYSLNPQSQKIAEQLAQQADSVSVHIRRGDYVSVKTTNELHGLCSVKYYQNAMALAKKQVLNPKFYFFSDDPEWVEQHLLQDMGDSTLIRHNTLADSWQDMALMSKCKHHIIANSSFSWWGAWLGHATGKIVIAPANWFSSQAEYLDTSDLIPKNWIQLANE